MWQILYGKTKSQIRIHFGEHLRHIKSTEPDIPLAQFFYRGKVEGLKLKGIQFLKLSPRKGDLIAVLVKKGGHGFIDLILLPLRD